MKTIKIIDLLNMISKDEETPREIKYNNIEYFWCNQCKIYERNEDDDIDLYRDLDNLNDEVEIIEEDKKIEKIEIINNGNANSYAIYSADGTKCALTKHSKVMCDKINEIIDKLNEMSDKE